MADEVNEKDKANKKEVKESNSDNVTEKRKSTDKGDGEPEEKKFSMSLNSKKPLDSSKKISINFSNSPKTGLTPIKMSLSSQKPKETSVTVKPRTAAVAKVFNEEEDSDEEEMPPEAKMRMRNIGRDTPTAAGPNSFGKGRLGFCDRQKIFERDLKKHMEEKDND